MPVTIKRLAQQEKILEVKASAKNGSGISRSCCFLGLRGNRFIAVCHFGKSNVETLILSSVLSIHYSSSYVSWRYRSNIVSSESIASFALSAS